MNIHIKPQDVRKWLGALIIIPMMLAMFGKPTPAAAKCDPTKSDNCPVEAPGQIVNTTDTDTETPSGQVIPDNAVANGLTKTDDTAKPAPDGWTNTGSGADWKVIVDNSVTNPSGDTRIVELLADNTDYAVNTDVGSGVVITDTGTVILPGVGNTDNNGQHNGTGNNPNVVPLEDLLDFLAMLGFDCGTGASNANVACWNHYPPSNLWKINGSNGSPFAMPICFDTGNSNNPLIRDYGGFLIKASHWYHQVNDAPNGNHQYPRMVVGEVHSCS